MKRISEKIQRKVFKIIDSSYISEIFTVLVTNVKRRNYIGSN